VLLDHARPLAFRQLRGLSSNSKQPVLVVVRCGQMVPGRFGGNAEAAEGGDGQVTQ
jgi:hypothetical protein